LLALLPLFAGLLIALPVLGHATWHLYKRATVARLRLHDQSQESWRISGLAKVRLAAAAILEQESQQAADALSDWR
jgi:hypothetical protein